MKKKLKAAIVGLDTSHSVEFAKFMQDPSLPKEHQVGGMQVTRCLRFDTPFQSKEGLDKRQAYLESIGVKVTQNFDEAVADCDAIYLEINDPAYHLEYFKKCAVLGKPIFLDKPFADTLDSANEIMAAAKEHNIRFFTASSLRYDANLIDAASKCPRPQFACIWGPLGKAPASSSIVWYGVHAFEMLERTMGTGAVSVTAVPDRQGVVCTVAYADGRRGVVELNSHSYRYGGVLRNAVPSEFLFHFVGGVDLYRSLIGEIQRFFRGESGGVPLNESYEIMAMLEAADLSVKYGRTMPVYQN
ncbi:MAG: Oxidoreductase family, NAD-binding Rossmann fold [Lentisphaerae bacterium ADurb.Bin242]|nr:MAG: Oxidoreductase family, NAD-binding Rossmann fold [Lentisphaerae bacterium ADurb.Bin242]